MAIELDTPKTDQSSDRNADSIANTGTTARSGSPALTSEEVRDVAIWQQNLLPFMSRFLIILAVVFFAVSAFSVYEVRSFILLDGSTSARSVVEGIVSKSTESTTTSDAVQKGLIVIEADAIDKRYRQASAHLLSRIWTRQLAFLTGMVLAFIGAVFIIGKLSGSATEVNFGRESLKAAITSTSPGLILAFFGTMLMGVALVVETPIDIKDKPIYFVTLGIKPEQTESPNPSNSSDTESDQRPPSLLDGDNKQGSLNKAK